MYLLHKTIIPELINLNLITVSDSQFSCNICNKQYTDEDSLCQHKTSAHERVRYPCDQCNSKFFTMAAKLRRHKASAHEGVRYTCDQCDIPVKCPVTTQSISA